MGQMQFLLKWGMTNSTFRRIFTYKGQTSTAALLTLTGTTAI